MIVCTTQPVYRYSGLSTDIKPTPVETSTFWETDTGDEYEWRKNAWILRPSATLETPKDTILYEDENFVYICKAELCSSSAAAVWQIKRLDISSGVLPSWCDGNALYDNLATDVNIVKNHNYS